MRCNTRGFPLGRIFLTAVLWIAVFVMYGGDSLCKEFIRDQTCEWIYELVTRCTVCLYRDECGESDNKTALIHGYHHVNKRNRVLK